MAYFDLVNPFEFKNVLYTYNVIEFENVKIINVRVLWFQIQIHKEVICES